MRYAFGDCTLDTRLYTLHRAGHTRQLRPKVFQVLTYLLAHRERVVSRQELSAQMWPDQYRSAAALESAIRGVRQAIGDSGRTQRLIQTLHGHGYRFIATVEVQQDVATDVEGAPPAETPRPVAQPTLDQATVVLPPPPGPLELPPPLTPVPITASRPEASRPGLPDAERRQLTVMVCALVAATACAGQPDPEDWRDVMRTYRTTCAEVIQRFEGHIAQDRGDGLLVYFGYPQAHEDDAQRAVRTGLGIIAAMGTLKASLGHDKGIRVAVQVGIHTGLVVVGESGSSGHQEQWALGETPTIAAGLQELAAPDTVVISAATARLVEGYFVCQPLEAQTLIGVSQPIRVVRVLQESGAQSRLDVVPPHGLTPLVGRDEEVALLHRRWEQAASGQGQVVLLSGEAGIGKSRLVQVLQDAVATEPHTRIEWRGSPSSQQRALHPVIDHLHRRLQGLPGDPPSAQLHALEAMLTASGVVPSEAVPLLAALLSLPLPAFYPPLTLTPQRQRQRTFDTLLAWLHAEAQRQPLLVVVEDLHWLDPSTVELLSLLMDQGAQARLCLILTARPEFHPTWAMGAHVTELTLRRLAPDQVVQVATHVAGDKALPAEVVAQIVAKTDGVPLFAEELTKMVLESGLLQEGEAHYELSGPLPPLAIPATLQDALLARLDRLGAAKRVAQLGATIGRTFPYDLLQAVAPLDAATLQGALAQLVEAGVVAQRGRPPQATYTFKHALIQDTAYQSLLKSTRQQYHQRIAQALEGQFLETAEAQPALLAHHALRGEVWDKALTYCRQAGEQALAQSAYREAVEYFEQALSALPHLPEQPDTRAQAIDLRLALRSALLPSADHERILACLREAEAHAEALDDPRRLAQVSRFLSNQFLLRGMYDQAIAAAQRAIALATASGDGVLRAQVHNFLGLAYRAQGNHGRAIDCLRQAMAFFEREQRRERLGDVIAPAVLACAYLIASHAELGTFVEGRALGDAGLRIAKAVAHPPSLMIALWGIGMLALRQGDLLWALPWLERAMGLCQDADLPLYFPQIAAPLGEAYTLSGRVADALSLLTQAIERSAATERARVETICSLPLGEAYVLAGCLEEAHACAERALARARERQECGRQAYALRLLGEITARSAPPEHEHAAAHYRQALALAEELCMRPLVAHCHRSLGTLYATVGQQAQARTALTTAMEMYRAMEMTFWLPQAETVLAQVDGR